MKNFMVLAFLMACLGTTGVSAVASEDQQQPIVNQAEVDKAFKDLNETLTKARAVPYMENGQPAGYQVFQQQQGGIYQKMGLRNGDVIKSVDGQAVNDPSQALQELGALKKARNIEIVRDGREQSAQYNEQTDPPAQEQ